MSYVYLDDCMYHLYLAQEALNNYHEIDSYMEIFEADNPQVQQQAADNAQAKTGILENLKAAAMAVLRTIQNMISSITDFFRKSNMKEEERRAYEEFKAKCAKDPSLKDKRITVLDFRKFNEQYQSLLNEAEAADRELAAGKDYPLDDLIQKISGFCGNAGKGLMVSVGCEAALNFASSSTEAAQIMLKTLKEDEELQKTLVENIGKHETKKFERQMKSLGKRISLRREIMKLKGTASHSFEDAISNTIHQVQSICGGASQIVGTLPQNDPTKSKVSNTLNTAKAVVTNPKQMYSAAKNVAKGSNILRRASASNGVRNVVRAGMELNNEKNNIARQMVREQNKEARMQNKKKKFRIQDQSLRDSIMGVNDPNAVTHKVKKRLFNR